MPKRKLLLVLLALIILTAIVCSYLPNVTLPQKFSNKSNINKSRTSGYVISGGEITPKDLQDAPRKFVYQVKEKDGSIVNINYTAPASSSKPKKDTFTLDLYKSTITAGDHITARGTYDKETNTLLVHEKGDYIKTADKYYREQLGDKYTFGDQEYMLVWQTSMNFGILPATDFAGVLTKNVNEKDWRIFLSLISKPISAHEDNNPYALWKEGDYLYMMFADDHGAGSGEGIGKIVNIRNNKWSLIYCLYLTEESLEKFKTSNFSNISLLDMFEYDSQSNKYYRTQLNYDTGEKETLVIDNCFNFDIKINGE